MHHTKRSLSLFLSIVFVFTLICSVPITASASTPFTDITGNEYYNAIDYVYNNDIMNGMTSTTFGPNETITRGMIVTILYRISGSIEEIDPVGFSDIPEGRYFYYPIGWAQYYGIANGYSDGTFKPQDSITNEELITFLYRYVTEYQGKTPKLISSTFVEDLDDYISIHSYGRVPINWAMNCGVIDSDANTVSPRSNSLRGKCADYIYRFMTLDNGDAKAFSMSNMSTTTTSAISNHLNTMGYEAEYQYNLTANQLEYAFYNQSVIYTHSHGFKDKNGISLYNGTELLINDINVNKMIDAELVYISACLQGNAFCVALYEAGNAQCVVGFEANISAHNDSDGILKFNRLVFQFLRYGNTLQDSIDLAQSYFTPDDQEEFGISSIRVHGDYYH